MKPAPYHYRMFVDGMPWYSIGWLLWVVLMVVVLFDPTPADWAGQALIWLLVSPLAGLVIGWLIKGPFDLAAWVMDAWRGFRSRV